MFSKNDLLKYCTPVDLMKIKRMYDDDYIQWSDFDDSRYPLIDLQADILSENKLGILEVTVTIDYKAGLIKKGGCRCSYIKKYNRPCEHLLLTVYDFLDNVEKGYIVLSKKIKKRDSDYRITQAIEYLSRPSVNDDEFDIADKSGDVHINSEIKLPDEYDYYERNDNYMKVSFNLSKGGRKSYVIKNISEFQKHIVNESKYVLGKDFEVTLCLDSFDSVSLPLAKFIASLPSSGDSYAGEDRYYSYYSNNGGGVDVSRELTLKGKYLDDFMKAIEASGVSVYHTSENRKKAEIYQVIDGKMNINTSIKKVNDGYEIDVENKHIYIGKKFYYTVDDENNMIIRSKQNKRLYSFLHSIQGYENENVFISDSDMKSFTNLFYDELEKHTYLKKENFLPEKYALPKPIFEFYLDKPQDGMITAEIYAIYGDKKYNALETIKKDLKERNDQEEKNIDRFVSQFFNSFDPIHDKWVIINDDDKIYALLTEGIERLQEKGKVFISDALKKLTIRPMEKFSVGVSVQSDLLQLDLNTDKRTLEDLADILSRYTPKKKYYRLKNGSFVTIDDDSELETLSKLAEDLQLSNKDIKKGQVSIPKYRALYLEKMNEESNLEINRDEYFRDLIQNIEDINQKEFPIPECIQATLREYQKEGYEWLCRLQANGFAALLADEMGLGKTLQVITFMASLNDGKRKLVVCPASLVYNWASELEKFAPALSYVIVSGSPDIRAQAIQNSKEGDILITSYDSLKRDFDYYEKMRFSVEVIDEAQFIKNANTQAAQSVKEINSSFRIALTGTPIENRLSELWSIFDYLLPGFLYRYRYFKSNFESPIVKDRDEEQEEKLRNMIAPFILRRYKKDVLKDLPDKLEEVYYAPLEGEQKELYDARVQRLKITLAKETKEEFNKNKIAVLAELTRLRQICCSPSLVYENYKGNSNKEDLCIDLIHTAVESGHKVLLFSQFTSMLESLNKRLTDEGISYYYLHGGTDKKERARLVNEFQNNDVSVFCISLKAGGTGLNLTAADIVIHYDPWWNTAVENQATDRTHRIGQDKVVTVYKLIMKDTLEERIVALQSSKADLAKEMLSGEEMGSTTFTREQLLDILD